MTSRRFIVTLAAVSMAALSLGAVQPGASRPVTAAGTEWPARIEKELYAEDWRGKKAPEFVVEEVLGTRPAREGKVTCKSSSLIAACLRCFSCCSMERVGREMPCGPAIEKGKEAER